jgi:hypothetical protein
MGVRHLRKLKVGYWPLSTTLDSAGDRRRLVFWAKARGHVVITDLSQKVDVVVASENSDFNAPCFTQSKVPIIFDLVDAYLSPLNSTDDLMRGIAKKVAGQISGDIKPFSHHVKDFCLNSTAVICSSVEQQEVIASYCTNAHVILDSHDEIPLILPAKPGFSSPNKYRILWEGQPATIRGIKLVSPALTQLSKIAPLSLELVTDETYFKFLNKYLKRSTYNLIKREVRDVKDLVNITPWTPKNLVSRARESSIGILPIDLSVPMQKLKPENRLLIMWRLGLPCLTSPSPSYMRVANSAGVDLICDSPARWLTKLEELLQNPTYAYQEVVRGQNYLLKMHTRDVLLKKWDQAIESVM